jgi:hypothetical protein
MSAEEERQALLGLALASLPNEEEVRKAIFADDESEPPRLGEALRILGDLTREEGARVSHRVLSLDLLAKVAHRRGVAALEPVATELHHFVEAAVIDGERVALAREEPSPHLEAVDEPLRADAGAPEPPPPAPVRALEATPSDDPRVHATVQALLEVEQLVPSGEHYWRTFAKEAKDALALSDDEVFRPICTDDQEVDLPGGTAVRTAVWFWSDKPAKDFQAWTDPRTWDKSCHLFFKSVVQKPGAAISATVPEFSATFTETVYIDGSNTLSTDLEFSRSVDEPHLYALEFALPGPPAPGAAILVDTGQVTVREDPNAPTDRRTALLAEKYILFDGPYATWPTLACDLFWTEFAITMALGC